MTVLIGQSSPNSTNQRVQQDPPCTPSFSSIALVIAGNFHIYWVGRRGLLGQPCATVCCKLKCQQLVECSTSSIQQSLSALGTLVNTNTICKGFVSCSNIQQIQEVDVPSDHYRSSTKKKGRRPKRLKPCSLPKYPTISPPELQMISCFFYSGLIPDYFLFNLGTYLP